MASFNFGDLHPAIVHFPIALIFIVFVFDILYWVKKDEMYKTLGNWFLYFAALLFIPTAFTGLLAKEFFPAGDPDITRHQMMALITVTYTILYAIYRGYAHFHRETHSIYLYLLLSLINVGLVSTTAEFGGIVARGRGIIFESLKPKTTAANNHNHNHNHNHALVEK